jgi:hypothetical protein
VSKKLEPLLIRRPTTREWSKIRYDILKYIEQNGPYTHNLISLTLRQIGDKYGLQIADEAVEKFGLDKLFGIQPEVVRQVGKAIAGG